MLGKFKICPVNYGLAFRYTCYTGFKVVRPEDARYSTEIFIGIDVCGGPAFLILGHKSLNVGIAAVRQHCHKDIRLDGRAVNAGINLTQTPVEI